MRMPGERLEIEITPGTMFPNWSVVASVKTAEALGAFLKAFDAERRWAGITPEEDRVRRAILVQYVAAGRAPTTARLAELTGLCPEAVGRLLKNLDVRDLVVLDRHGGTITGAYPFSESATGHRVHIGGGALNAMCAIDALGAGAMYGEDSTVDSSCLNCARPVRVATGDGGGAIVTLSPGTAVVWSGVQNTGGCSADTMCRVMAFFCSDDCLDQWRGGRKPAPNGFRLSMDEGLQMGKAIFMPLLAAAP